MHVSRNRTASIVADVVMEIIHGKRFTFILMPSNFQITIHLNNKIVDDACESEKPNQTILPLAVSNLSDSSLVMHIKEQLSERLHIPVEEQRLIMNGKFLNDNNTLLSEKIVDGSHVYLLLSTPRHEAQLKDTLENLLKGVANLSDADRFAAINSAIQRYSELLDTLSLDDIERYASAMKNKSQGES
ncbi:Nedd8-like protein RUB1 [Trichinella spiralis]|uniref:Nedd8-like protein RUB1 n=1 Tax=Trichinella spiralis TaxID=6334 RepID=A0A0V1BSS3_TRISP|nr:Nedd8-like protein RUB1 [Trichinella spiralis]